jgi:hypothetical protein
MREYGKGVERRCALLISHYIGEEVLLASQQTRHFFSHNAEASSGSVSTQCQRPPLSMLIINEQQAFRDQYRQNTKPFKSG